MTTITVVTACMNMGSYLEETIRSVLANLGPGDEYFVIDGASTDDTVDIIRRHEAALTGWVSEPDRGYADALAKGFARAQGDLLCWLNAGDLLLTGSLDHVRAQFTDDIDLIFGDDFYIDEASRVISFSRGWIWDLRAAMLHGGWTPLQDACFWRRSLYEAAGGIDPAVKYAADYDLFLRMAGRGRCRYVPVAYSAFRQHAGQKSISGARAYRDERAAARAREIARSGAGGVAGLIRDVIQSIAVRWRIRVMQRRWTRADLAGRPVTSLPCAPYWPQTSHGERA